MANGVFDVCIIGSGVSGSFAAHKIALEYPDVQCAVFETGRPPLKRRLQMSGFLGLLPSSDGKLYVNDLKAIKKLCGDRKAENANEWFKNKTKLFLNNKIIKDTHPFTSIERKIKSSGFSVSLNNFVQIMPSEIHGMTKQMSADILNAPHISTFFDTDIIEVKKSGKNFILTTHEEKEIECKKLLLAIGRSGWRWAIDAFDCLKIKFDNSVGSFGIRAELPDIFMHEFNKSNCILKSKDVMIGPFCWNGTVIPEDHIDMVIAAYRGNESRWETNKVSFNILVERPFDDATQEIDRIGQLTWILANDRVFKEKISTILTKKSKVSIMGEYDWLSSALEKASSFLPHLAEQGSFYVPALIPLTGKPKLKKTLETTSTKGVFCAGETAGKAGLLFSMLSGIIAGDAICQSLQ